MTGTLLLIRHAKAAGQAPDAPLTPEGRDQAAQLAETLAGLGITRIVSSPWVRGVDTAQPLAERLGLPVQTDERLTERVLSGTESTDWPERLRESFSDDRLTLPGGESGHTARTRILAALEDARDPVGMTAVVSHGNLLALALGLDYDGWAGLRNPDVWVWTAKASARWEPA
ncbi:histidine phosphatase family protein [Deinococcus sp. Arct2-2]|uniref:histidine phosphatase family protein n=1 Tax=Deinococcus sp. Arct2-2 TaxID=2568653 RepID=UPI0010A329E4|nr:histidine phosphatase family protein [Deinococcus sp. Arct2-2]THF71959.1 histidine phosphatase family protein [Deinococcus sp. Arct2-2]